MFEDVGEQRVLAALAAGDTAAARQAMEALLGEELDDLVPAEDRRGDEAGDFSGALNHASSRLLLQFIGQRAAARSAVYALDRVRTGDGHDLLRLLNDGRSPRQAIRQALLAADFLARLVSTAGQRRLLKLANYLKRKYLHIDLEAEDAAAEANLRLLRNLPTSEEYLRTTLKSVFADAARHGRQTFEVAVDDGLDEDGQEGPAWIERQGGAQPAHENFFSRLRRERLFDLLRAVSEQIPGLKITLPGKQKAIILGERHRKVFDLWLSLEPAVRLDVEMTVHEMCRVIGCSDKTLAEDFRRLQVALSQRDEYAQILELMLPIRYRGDVPADYRQRFDQFIRTERENFQALVRSWRSELFQREENDFARIEWRVLKKGNT
ncbi:MAG TPA: hypothetical protein PLB97_00655 [Accumulibacter sp.]|nr:hypothetical protein [Accumulibacter sp.]HPP47490.1 hypothetical protein [Accumulibacter sp.]